jgi:GNAT superfamily N-acetyltransferase
MTEASIRTAVPADLDALVALLGELFAIEADFRPDPKRQRRGLALLLEDRLRRAVFVAEVPGGVVGMVTGQLVVSTSEGAAAVWVEDMVVAEGARRAGLGRRLLQAIEKWGTARGATRLQLLADRENLHALRFYEARGWSGTRLVCLRRGGV